MLIARKGKRKLESPPESVQENKSRACSLVGGLATPGSDSEGGESEDGVFGEDMFCESPSLNHYTSSNALPTPQSPYILHSTSSSASSSDLNCHRYEAPASTMHSAAVMSSGPSDCGYSASDPMHFFPTLQTTSKGVFDSSYGADTMAPMEIDWGSYANTSTTTPGYDSFGSPVSGAAYSTPVSRQNSAQIMGPEGHSPMRATISLEASSSALTEILQTLLKTNTKFTIETNH